VLLRIAAYYLQLPAIDPIVGGLLDTDAERKPSMLTKKPDVME